MAIDDEKAEVVRASHKISKKSNSLKEKDCENPTAAHLTQPEEEYAVSLKTWCVVVVSPHIGYQPVAIAHDPKILSLSYGISFWIVPSLSACGAVVATQLGDPTRAAWYVSLYTITVTIAFMVCGANSDLFGRRWFIVGGNAILFVGFILGGSAKNNTSMLAAMSLIGFVSLIGLVMFHCIDCHYRVLVTLRLVRTSGTQSFLYLKILARSICPSRIASEQVACGSHRSCRWVNLLNTTSALLNSADAGVYFAVLVGPVSGSFAAQRADTVSLLPRNGDSNRLTESIVALDLLRSRYCRLLQLFRVIFLLLSTQTSPRYV
jgi:MFS family permease